MILSIITINFNIKVGLLKTLYSLRIQKDPSFEHIIIDGGSTDGSKEVIESYATEKHDYFITWINEKESGIYNTLNMGIKMAIADFVQFLNSGDCLYYNNYNDLGYAD